MSEEEGKAVFAALRPLCVKVMSEPSVESLTALQAGVKTLPPSSSIPPQLVDYLTLPLRAAIKRAGSSNERLLESSLLALTEIFSRVKDLNGWQLFHDLFSFLCMLLDPKMAKEAGFGVCSEDLLVSSLKALKALLLSTSSSIHKQLFGKLVILGHCISILLDSTSNSTSNTVRKEALSVLCALAGLDTAPILAAVRVLQTTPPESSHAPAAISTYLDIMKEEVGRIHGNICGDDAGVLASFLPGVSSIISRLVTSDAKTVESVTSLALLAWAHYITVAMSGQREEEEGLETSRKEEECGHTSQSSLKVSRTKAWEEKTSRQLCLLMERVCILVTSEAWKLRLHLVGWAHCLLSHCYISLEVCVPCLLQVVVTLSHDPYSHISQAAHTSLHQFPAGGHTLTSLLGEQLYSLTSSLPRLIRQHDDTKKVATLQLLAGYLNLAGSPVTLMTHSLPHLSRLIQALIQTMTLQTDSTHVLTTPLPTLDPAALPSLPLPLQHAHFRSSQVAGVLREVCQLLGCRGDFEVLLDYVLDQFQSTPQHHKEYLLLFSHFLTGASHMHCLHTQPSPNTLTSKQMFALVETLVTILVSPDIWCRSHNPTMSHPSRESDLMEFLLLYVIFTCVHVLGANFDPLLQQLIYPLMQQLGNSSEGVASAAMATLLAISSHCGYKSLAELIDHNADYLVHTISLHLQDKAHHHLQPRALQVLRAVLSHGEEGVCLLVQDSLKNLFISLDTKELDPRLVWVGLRTLSQSCERWVSTRTVAEEEEERVESVGVVQDTTSDKELSRDELLGDEPRDRVGIEAIGEYFRQYHKAKEAERAEDEEKERPGGEDEGDEVYYKEEKLPAVEQVCVQVLERCVHHLANPDPNTRLLILESMEHSMKALKHKKLTLYPEMHAVWGPLLPHLQDPSHPVARKAWQVILCMSEVSGDFLRKRILEKVWPILVTSLESMARVSLKADSLYQQSSRFKLQCCLIECVGRLSTSLSLPPHEFEVGAIAVSPYLSQDQPLPLQTLSSTCFQSLTRMNPDITWLVLSQLLPSATNKTTPTNSILKPYKFHENPNSAKYKETVSSLLELLT